MESHPGEHGPGLVTSTTLLAGLGDPDNVTVWRLYVDRYRPLIVRYATRLGVPPEDAEDVAQTTLLGFSQAYRDGRYERDRGRLSSWLFGLARNRVRDWCRRRDARRERELFGEGSGPEPSAADELAALWEEEWNDAILWQCLKVVRTEVTPETMRAFELFALEERPAEDVARALGTTANAVFGAKRRVVARVRELMPRVAEDF